MKWERVTPEAQRWTGFEIKGRKTFIKCLIFLGERKLIIMLTKLEQNKPIDTDWCKKNYDCPTLYHPKQHLQ